MGNAQGNDNTSNSASSSNNGKSTIRSTKGRGFMKFGKKKFIQVDPNCETSVISNKSDLDDDGFSNIFLEIQGHRGKTDDYMENCRGQGQDCYGLPANILEKENHDGNQIVKHNPILKFIINVQKCLELLPFACALCYFSIFGLLI